jgi:hypothetical protein
MDNRSNHVNVLSYRYNEEESSSSRQQTSPMLHETATSLCKCHAPLHVTHQVRCSRSPHDRMRHRFRLQPLQDGRNGLTIPRLWRKSRSTVYISHPAPTKTTSTRDRPRDRYVIVSDASSPPTVVKYCSGGTLRNGPVGLDDNNKQSLACD